MSTFNSMSPAQILFFPFLSLQEIDELAFQIGAMADPEERLKALIALAKHPRLSERLALQLIEINSFEISLTLSRNHSITDYVANTLLRSTDDRVVTSVREHAVHRRAFRNGYGSKYEQRRS